MNACIQFTIIFFSNILLVRIRPTLYKKKPAYMFEMNKIILKPHLDMSRGVFGFPGKNKNESRHKTVVMCCQIVERKSLAASGAEGQWTRSGILKKKNF